MTGTRLKAIYLLLYMGFATWRVFYNVFLEANGFTGLELGTINALMQAAVVIVVPLWGIMADKRGIRPIMQIAAVFAASLIFFMGKVLFFPVLVGYLLLYTFFYHPLGPLTDAMAMQYSVLNPKYDYGKFRLWGSLGWAIASLAGGYVFMQLSIDYIFPVTAIFFLLLVFLLQPPKQRKVIYKPNFQPIRIKEVFGNKQLLILLAVMFFYGLTCSPIHSFLNLYFTELKANNTQIGIAYAIQAMSELPLFFIGGRLVKRMGAARVIIIAMLMMAVRQVLYGTFPDIELAMWLAVLQGGALSFFLVGMVESISERLPEGRHATAQSLIWGIYVGVGQTTGNFMVGLLKDSHGIVHTMTYSGIGIFIVVFIFALYLLMQKRHTTNTSA